jgi:hypothetical protein
MLDLFASESLDLADAGEIIVEQGIHPGSSFALEAIPASGCEGVDEGSGRKDWDWKQSETGQSRVVVGKHGGDDRDLQDSDNPLLDPIDQNPLYRTHILDDPRHQIACCPVVKPSEREMLQVRVEIAPKIKNNLLLKGVVKDDPYGIQKIMGKEGCCRGQDQWEKELGALAFDRLINGYLRDGVENDNKER